MFRKDISFNSQFSARKITRDAQDQVRIGMTFKHVSEGEVQHFLTKFDETTGVKIEHNFQLPINWKSISYQLPNIPVNVMFDEMDFDGYLTGLKVTHKITPTVELFEYKIEVEKVTSIDNFDTQFEEIYFKKKEEDENGKSKLVDFVTEITMLSEAETLM